MTTNTPPQHVDRERPRQEPGPFPSLGRRWPWILLATVVAALGAYAVSDLVLPAVYRSSSTVIVTNQAAVLPDGQDLPIDPFVDDQSLSETFEQLALQPSVADPVARELGMRTKQLQEAVSVHAVPRTPLVIISFQAENPAAATRGAQAYTAQFVTSTRRSSFLPGKVLVVSGATRPADPVGPRSVNNALVAGAAALALSLGLVLARGTGAARREERDLAAEDEAPHVRTPWQDDPEHQALSTAANGRRDSR